MTAAPRQTTAAAPAYRERVLLDDGELIVSEARCDALPVQPGETDRSRHLEFVFGLSGVFVRQIAPRGGRRETIGMTPRHHSRAVVPASALSHGL